MATGEFSVSDKFGLGYVKPIGKPWRPVIYSNVDGKAVVEGCIVLGTVDEMELLAARIRQFPLALVDPDAEVLGVAIVGQQFRWPSLDIPYTIAPGMPDTARIDGAIAEWQAKTRFRFKRRVNEANYIVFASGGGCSSSVGMQGGAQTITLGAGCGRGNAIHEIGHALGLWHEQSRADRDANVEVLWQNIIPLARHNFEQHISDGLDLGAYDFGSIMHYPANAFGIDGRETLRPRRPASIGQRDALSAGDVAAIEAIYADLYAT